MPCLSITDPTKEAGRQAGRQKTRITDGRERGGFPRPPSNSSRQRSPSWLLVAVQFSSGLERGGGGHGPVQRRHTLSSQPRNVCGSRRHIRPRLLSLPRPHGPSFYLLHTNWVTASPIARRSTHSRIPSPRPPCPSPASPKRRFGTASAGPDVCKECRGWLAPSLSSHWCS
ncbi:hypothetical protein LX36DRAFT_369278 [Colletotrichum falcatum]|nr:hypothetical protein LX36DRAFT_369278 [Colletotrichum falcatum]